MCGQAPESISHIASECSELAGDEYKIQYDKVGSTVRRACCQGGGDYHNQHHHPKPGKRIATEEVNFKFVVRRQMRCLQRRGGEQAPSLTSALDDSVGRKYQEATDKYVCGRKCRKNWGTKMARPSGVTS